LKKTRLLIAKTLLATLILLMLSLALFSQHAFAGSFPPGGSPPSAVTANVGTTVVTSPPFDNVLSVTYPTVKPGNSFYAYVDVINVTSLFSYEVGFTFNYTVLQINNVTDGGFLTSKGGKLATFIPADLTYSNTTGDVPYSGAALQGPLKAPTGSGHLLKVGFCINPALSSPASLVSLMHFNTSSDCDYQLKLSYNATGTPNITPPMSQVYDGRFSISGPIPEFSSVFFTTLLITVTFAAALISKAKLSRQRKV
jgi:hypothetical protein